MTEDTSFFLPGKRIHMVGLCETTMSSLAMLLNERGFTVTGSDMFCSSATDRLRNLGIQFCCGHRAENIKGADCVIRTVAVRDDNPEIIAAKAGGIPIIECAQILRVLMQEYQNIIHIAGNVLGRNATSAMLVHIFMEAKRDPTVMIREHLSSIKSNYRNGRGDTFILESSTWINDALPHSLVVEVNALDADFFPQSQAVEKVNASFHRVTGLPPKSGFLISGEESARPAKALSDDGLEAKKNYISYGLSSDNDVHLMNVDAKWHGFDIVCGGTLLCHVDLKVYGKKHALSALAAAAVAWRMGISQEAIVKGLESYPGAAGYLEYKGTCCGADVFDDSSYQPVLIKALLESMREMGYGRVIVAIKPQFLARSKDYISELADTLVTADVVAVTEAYGIRELGLKDTISQELTASLPGAVFLKSLSEMSGYLLSIAHPGDVILTVGNGDFYKVSEMICNQDVS